MTCPFFVIVYFSLFNLFNDGPEGIGMVHCEICKGFPVEGDTLLFEIPYKLGIAHIVLAYSCIYSLDPQ